MNKRFLRKGVKRGSESESEEGSLLKRHQLVDLLLSLREEHVGLSLLRRELRSLFIVRALQLLEFSLMLLDESIPSLLVDGLSIGNVIFNLFHMCFCLCELAHCKSQQLCLCSILFKVDSSWKHVSHVPVSKWKTRRVLVIRSLHKRVKVGWLHLLVASS